ncbi:hypothetical protein BKA65DRAFT_143063 [Rhexocercosporidium sp. MPI-PUGE-AT-0058]|nr:hypothetical protein BKA65DRAFT_143063 [Rhexocercosporidium sp. MPI-PUGE-AT-0058]
MERHDDSPNPVQRDRTEMVSESQIITGGGVMRNDFLSDFSPNSRVVSRFSSPSFDDGSGYHTSTSTHSPSLVLDGSIPTQLASLSPARGLNATPSMHGPGPISMPNGEFMCPQCPRKFDGFVKASRHLQEYRHTFACPVAGCRWSFCLDKDLRRHSLQRTHRPRRLSCPVVGCNHKRPGSDNTFSRPDLLKRHMTNFHRPTPAHESTLINHPGRHGQDKTRHQK